MKEDGERDPSGERADDAAMRPPLPADAPPSAEVTMLAPVETADATRQPAMPPVVEGAPETAQPEVAAPPSLDDSNKASAPAVTSPEVSEAEPPAPVAAPAAQAAARPGRGADLAAFAASRLAGAVLTLVVAGGLLWLALPAATIDGIDVTFDRLAVTLPLLGLAVLLAGLVGAGVGLAALMLGRPVAWLATGIGMMTTGLSPLLLALLLALAAAGPLHWLPSGGFVPWQQDVTGALASLALPTIALGLPLGLAAARSLLDAAAPILARGELDRGAETGLKPRRALLMLVLPEAVPDALAGLVVPLCLLPPLTLVVEAVFYLPGLSRSVLAPLAERDAGGLWVGLFALVALVIVGRLVLDLWRGALDPRLTDRR